MASVVKKNYRRGDLFVGIVENFAIDRDPLRKVCQKGTIPMLDSSVANVGQRVSASQVACRVGLAKRGFAITSVVIKSDPVAPEQAGRARHRSSFGIAKTLARKCSTATETGICGKSGSTSASRSPMTKRIGATRRNKA